METSATHVGRYKIREPLGRGAMGIVYKAEDPTIKRLVAVKTISQLVAGAEAMQEFRTRLAVEAQAAGRLSHPNIVTIYDVGETEDDQTPYVVMEYLAGPSLHKRLADSGGRIPWKEALEIARDLALALHYAHAQGIIHRDIKPANILFTEEGTPKIADFGIARLNLSDTTLAGHVVGTPAYMSPEQVSGEPIDGRADLFSLGVVLYAMLTGHRPFQGNSALTISFKVVHGDPVPVSALDCALPSDVDYVLTRLLAKNPSDRYSDGEELALDLDDLLNGRPPRSRSGIFLAPHPAQSSSSERLASIRHTSVSRRVPVSNNTAHGTERIVANRSVRQRILWLAAGAIVVAAIVTVGLSRSRKAVVASPPTQITTAADASTIPATAGNAEAQKPLIVAASTPSPSPALPRRSAPRAASKPEVSSALALQVHHPFEQGKLSLWIDDRLAFSTDLHGSKSKRLLVFNSVKGYESAMLPVPQGQHRVRLRITADGYDQATLLSASFSTHREQTLRVTCSTNPPKLRADVN
jgi:serine/threonine-protein kinase